jgi:tungstate transport system permease protein
VNQLGEATMAALQLLVSADAGLWNIIGVSFAVSLQAIVFATPPALAIALALSYGRFPGRHFLIAAFNTLLSVPAVVVGLTLYLLLSHQGPLGDLRLLFTQPAMVLGQIALSLPILVAMGHAALQGTDRRAWETARTLGAGPLRTLGVVLYEARFGLIAAMLAAFGRIIAEVGASLMLGGNIANYTRNIPTAIALETSKGEFAQGIALGLVLLFFSFAVNLLFHRFQGQGQVRQQ